MLGEMRSVGTPASPNVCSLCKCRVCTPAAASSSDMPQASAMRRMPWEATQVSKVKAPRLQALKAVRNFTGIHEVCIHSMAAEG